MTAYQGGKGRLGKKIARVINFIEDDLNYANSRYIEPFCGMCGVMYHMSLHHRDREIQGIDINGDIIEMWRETQRGWDPPESCSRQEFENLKRNNRETPSAVRGFLGSVSSYGNIFMGYYRLHLQPTHRNYVKEGKSRVLKLAKELQGVHFKQDSYENAVVDGAVVYCDPPYFLNGFKTDHFQQFDHQTFWETMRKWSSKSIVIVSERTAPEDFTCIWSLDVNFSINKTSLTKTKECLFLHSSTVSKMSTETLVRIQSMS